MVTVSIPEPAKPIIERLIVMSDEELSAIKTALEKVPLSLRVDKYSEQLKRVVAKGTSEMQDVVQVIASLTFAPRDPSISAEVLAKAVATAVISRKDRTSEEAQKTASDLAILETRLRDLFNNPHLKIYSRATDVQHQYEHILTDARIMSDIRTVFDPDGDGSQPLGAMVVHTLKITHMSNRSYRDSYFALDNADLTILSKAIGRAAKKTASLEEIIRNNKLRYFESK